MGKKWEKGGWCTCEWYAATVSGQLGSLFFFVCLSRYIPIIIIIFYYQVLLVQGLVLFYNMELCIWFLQRHRSLKDSLHANTMDMGVYVCSVQGKEGIIHG